MKVFRYILAAVLFAAACPLYAQWSCGVDAAAGIGYLGQRMEDLDQPLHRYSGQGALRLGYRSPRFTWSSSLGANYDFRETDTYRFALTGENLDMDNLDGADSGDITMKNGTARTLGIDYRNDFRWTPSARQTYDAWTRYQFRNSIGIATTIRAQGDVSDSSSGEDLLASMGMYVEEPVSAERQMQLGVRARREFLPKRRVLSGELSVSGRSLDKTSVWFSYKDETGTGEASHVYRITPYTGNLGVQASVHLMDSVMRKGPARLVLDPGVRFWLDNTADRSSGATLIDMETDTWRDSTRLRENFDYLTLRVEPYLSAQFSWRALRIHADYSPQLYFRRLTDERHTQRLQLAQPYPVGGSWASWTFSPQHKVTLRSSFSVSHPSYIQICWYERHGDYLTQLYRGKEDLRSTQTYAGSVEYEFTRKRFSSVVSLSCSSRVNEVDQTYANEEIDGRSYQVFTWINAADSRILGITGTLGWNGKVLSAHTGVTYNGTVRTLRETGQQKKTNDWRVWADAKLSLPHRWTVDADLNYRSNLATFFTIFKEYCTLNVRVQKSFGKWSVFLSGRDLLDQDIEKSFLSADQKELWVESARLNRRILLLGGSWNF